MTTTKSFRSIITLSLALATLLGYSFINAAWTPAPANPPANNVPAPINVGTSTASLQSFRGTLNGNLFVAKDEVWSDVYCDGLGANCTNKSSPDYTNYAKIYCGFSVPNPGSVSLHGVKLKNNAFYDFYDKNGATSILEWVCNGPDSSVDYDIEDACGLSVPNPGSVSLNAFRLKNGTYYDLYDSNGGTAILEWICASPTNPELTAIASSCGLNVPNPGSVSLNGVDDQQGNFYDFWDSNGSTAKLVWSCQ